MSWASWTTVGVTSGKGGVRTDERGIVNGDLSVHTTWVDDLATITVQYSGDDNWFTVAGSPVPCPSERDSRELHQAMVEAVRRGGGVTVHDIRHATERVRAPATTRGPSPRRNS